DGGLYDCQESILKNSPPSNGRARRGQDGGSRANSGDRRMERSKKTAGGKSNAGLCSGDPADGFKGKIGKTFADSVPWWPPLRKAPKGAPNIIVMFLDDLGYSDFGAFGAEIETPNIDRLIGAGLRFSNYTTVPM